ncbi:protein mono-ADP-ribosyltransferase PARP12 isoform X2 [Esox lucius]|uniref:protein mono-ADP-ribosyltransferase PARP12 isoform X2 n=1 Tax=Esox lucius TaxID=8010 RepID=UPI0005774875|nr:protein mono-ADP-ribosyltransferase PARP12 isoform X2 [Esox lucius]
MRLCRFLHGKRKLTTYHTMASSGVNELSDQEDFSNSESSTEEQSDSDTEPQEAHESPGDLAQIQQVPGTPCRHYNNGHCRDGKGCHYLHVCKYALKGGCRHGAECPLKHPRSSPDSDGSSGSRERRRSSGREGGTPLDISGPYKWQLNDGHDWMDIANDHILEAQYSQPHARAIKLYNTPYGEVCIDFNSMRVRGKRNLRVRRLDGQQTDWIWYYHASRGWTKYGEKDSKGNPGPIQSSEIETKFQSNPNGSLTFNIGLNTFEIIFRQMRQVSRKRKRRVVRRPRYQPPQNANLTDRATSAFQRMSMSSAHRSGSPEWQYAGNSGRWHTFKHGSSSVSSADIEVQYQQNRSGTLFFTVKGQAYQLDFSAMRQTNLTTRMKRKIRRS